MRGAALRTSCVAGGGGLPIDVDALLAPVPGEEPAGADLSYDEDRLAIEAAFESGFSDEGEDKADVVWSDIVRLIESQLGKTKDLWLAAYLTRAGARCGELVTVEAGATVLAGLLEQYWPAVHPQLDEYGLQGRVTPCASLSSVGQFLGPLRRSILIAHPRLGEYSGADFERFAAGGDAEDGYGMFRAALADLGDDALVEAAARLDAVRDALRRADAVFDEQAPGEGPALQPVYDTLAQLRTALAAFTTQLGGEDEPVTQQSDDGAIPAAAGQGSTGGRVESREDVIRALDAIADYYRRREPSSPVVQLIKRARAWTSLDFLAVLEDIAPGSLDEVKRVLVSQREGEVPSWNEE